MAYFKVSNRPRGTLVYSFHLAWNQRVHLLNNMLRIGFLSQMALCQPIQEYYFDMARRADCAKLTKTKK